MSLILLYWRGATLGENPDTGVFLGGFFSVMICYIDRPEI